MDHLPRSTRISGRPATAVGLAVGLTLGLPAFGQEAAADGGDGIAFPGTLIETVVVPLPSEIFTVLDKLGGGNWKSELDDYSQAKVRGTRMSMALGLGVAIADGFVAVQAQDATLTRQIGRDVQRIAEALGLRKEVESHCQAILDAVDRGNWDAIREELDTAESSVRLAMQNLNDNGLAQCVSVGGWLRGTEALANTIGQSYTRDRAELLNQPMLVAHLTEEMRTVQKTARDTPTKEMVIEVIAGLGKVEEQMASAEEGFGPSPAATKQIGSVCGRLVDLIGGKP